MDKIKLETFSLDEEVRLIEELEENKKKVTVDAFVIPANIIYRN